jgi:hypothetical protein
MDEAGIGYEPIHKGRRRKQSFKYISPIPFPH